MHPAAPLVRKYEGLRLKAYLCPAGVPTIAYGHTKGVSLGDTCTLEQAEAWLREDLEEATKAVRRIVKTPLNENQEAALCDFVFNLGVGALSNSTLLKILNEDKNYAGVPEQLRRWNKARVDGTYVELPGLTARREAEVALWNTPVEGHSPVEAPREPVESLEPAPLPTTADKAKPSQDASQADWRAILWAILRVVIYVLKGGDRKK